MAAVAATAVAATPSCMVCEPVTTNDPRQHSVPPELLVGAHAATVPRQRRHLCRQCWLALCRCAGLDSQRHRRCASGRGLAKRCQARVERVNAQLPAGVTLWPWSVLGPPPRGPPTRPCEPTVVVPANLPQQLDGNDEPDMKLQEPDSDGGTDMWLDRWLLDTAWDERDTNLLSQEDVDDADDVDMGPELCQLERLLSDTLGSESDA